MDRAMSVEEKIRRAEEIYNRRNAGNYTYRQKELKKSPTLIHRMCKQIIICLIIYGLFYVVTNRDYFLSNEFQNKVQEVAAKNELLNNAYNYIYTYINKYINPEQPQVEEENTQTIDEGQSEEINTENIGGSNEEVTEATSEKTQEEQDVDSILETTSFIVPIAGTISSTFGWRTPTTATVPKYHTGLDIAATTGTVIKSATDGVITLASSEGDYGKHYKISTGDITIIYAHCSKLYFNEGDVVYQGEEIAEVGSTGNSTRTTFTF
jgi:murein DD-endopeptidase MepM/ murein hydrolase activator NlpD